MNFENYDNPSEWVWTNADKLFLKVIEEAHKRGIRIILDYSWNHTGTNFWAFQDLLRKGKNSPYKDWYIITRFDNPATPENEFDYQGWFGTKSLPEIRETVHQSNAALKAYEGTKFYFHSRKDSKTFCLHNYIRQQRPNYKLQSAFYLHVLLIHQGLP